MKYAMGHGVRRIPRRIYGIIAILVVLAVTSLIVVDHIYTLDLRPVSQTQKTVIFTVASGSSVKQIADLLLRDHLIRSSWALQLYVHSETETPILQAGTYALSPSLSTAQIVKLISTGSVQTNLVTILPGKRIDQVQADLINDGYAPAVVSAALSPSQYVGLPIIADKPTAVTTLEGLLWPDSFQRDSTTPLSTIIRESLVETGNNITPVVQADLAAEGLTPYQGLILASIVDQEVSKPSDQAQVAQVFLSRLKMNMPLGSDVTAYYGSIIAGQAPSLSYDSPYNTLLHTGLPPTPIATVSATALAAVVHPAMTNWLYFVAGDNGTTYFSSTLAQQQANTAAYCHKLCGQ